MKKRGYIYFLYLILEIAFAIVILISAKEIIQSFVSNEAFDKAQLAKDISLQINALYTVPGNMYVINENRRNFSVSFSDGLVRMYKKEKEKNPAEYMYVGIEEKYFEKNLYNPNRIILKKNSDDIDVDQEVESLNQLNCPKIATVENDWRNKYKIFIDPGHGDSKEKKNPGIESSNLKLKKESEITLAIAQGIKALNPSFELTRDFETYIAIQDRKDKLKEADVIISLHIGEYTNDKNSVKAYIPLGSSKYLESNRMACLIINTLLTNIEFDTASLIPINTKNIKAESPESILQLNDKIIVFLEIGNVNSDKGIEILDSIIPIPNLISRGIAGYFEE